MNADTPITLTPIGVIRSPHQTAAGTPIQPTYAGEFEGQVVVDEKFEAALDDIEGFERIWLIYLLDRAGAFRPKIIPYRDIREHGLLATRSPCRPNPIGLSVVELTAREGNILRIKGSMSSTAHRCSTSSPTSRNSTRIPCQKPAGWTSGAPNAPKQTTGSTSPSNRSLH